jgi:hypothetical protein
MNHFRNLFITANFFLMYKIPSRFLTVGVVNAYCSTLKHVYIGCETNEWRAHCYLEVPEFLLSCTGVSYSVEGWSIVSVHTENVSTTNFSNSR